MSDRGPSLVHVWGLIFKLIILKPQPLDLTVPSSQLGTHSAYEGLVSGRPTDDSASSCLRARAGCATLGRKAGIKHISSHQTKGSGESLMSHGQALHRPCPLNLWSIGKLHLNH